MASILFVCYGNICRSPMAEFVMKDKLAKSGLDDVVRVSSAATSAYEIGEDTHPGTKEELDKHHIPYEKRRARQITKADYDKFDYIIGMDGSNMENMLKLYKNDPQGKLSLLMDWTGVSKDVADPWFTGNFVQTFEDVDAGCTALLEHLRRSFKR